MVQNKSFFGIFLLFFISTSLLFSQDNQLSLSDTRAPCFQKTLDRLGQQYPEWECKYNNGIVSCSDKLISDPTSKLVFDKKTGRLFTGDCEACFRNGIRRYLLHYVNGRLDGSDTTYYRSGCPQAVRSFKLGQKEGTWIYYNDSSGLIAYKLNYQNDLKNGLSIKFIQHKVGTKTTHFMINGVKKSYEYPFYRNDTLLVEHFANGQLNGYRKKYGPDNVLRRKVHYVNGLMDGEFISYDTAKNVLVKIIYSEGEKDGPSKFYYNDGHIMKTGVWKKGKKNGAFKTFYPNGQLESIEHYKKGIKHGEFRSYSSRNSLIREAIYKKGELIEEHIYDKDGNEIKTVGEEKAKSKAEDDRLLEGDSK